MARSRTIDGPYELHPDRHVLTSRDRPDLPLQRAGHGDLVETQSGETYIAYLCGRPLPGRGRCILGRETALQKMVWGDDGWLRTVAGDARPVLESEAPDLPPHPFAPTPSTFDGPELPIDFQWLRTPRPEEIFSLTARPGHLRLYGRETIGSQFTQALVARRLTSHRCVATTTIEFEPAHFQQAAGLVAYYNAAKFHYLHVTQDEAHGKHLRVMSALPDAPQADAFTAPIKVPANVPLELRAMFDLDVLRFAWRVADAGDWNVLPETFDASILSDEAAAPFTPNFTGAFVGMACQDLAGTALHADFARFDLTGA
jgi:xylan 1,4-beta-xylosidase